MKMLREELLFCKQVPGRATAEKLFKITEDGVGSLWLGNEVSSNVQWMHCMIHRKALASKQLRPELRDVMTDFIFVTVKYIITRPEKAQISPPLCDHMAALYHSKSRWLSRGKVLSRSLICELRSACF